ncbi:hypothetical protein UFOVP402_40 [uncultured Caudovirales phage]|uniref:Uncharacterized protein n=1 Tax=uncultured Caudovirales phage TaxID=2100421 RepID=A0A6J5M9Y2_9CAUD|nr:hypothetical protein UFOVP402_40 [uncultured Caudovirales phage]
MLNRSTSACTAAQKSTKSSSLIRQATITTMLLLAVVFFVACSENKQPVFQSRNYDAECIIGKKYIIFGVKSENPFEPQAVATVIITDKQNGFVQYCWDYDFEKKHKVLFTRSCKEFIQASENNR